MHHSGTAGHEWLEGRSSEPLETKGPISFRWVPARVLAYFSTAAV